ncbi:sensor histidine kinase [Armatimonas rosea]|uniref:histidine kinase n=1 Tax=Armatimonas rosea TaxID=685828 RepID=A0A7W9W963_ARMRO|nr:ATP-binding protein [Armatimonas rosea]MBB6053523.1 signal transduction histidine kinase [Armatimonas rosea]
MMDSTMRRYDWTLGLCFFVLLALLLGNVFLANRSVYGLVESQRSVTHTWQVRTALHDLMMQFEASIAQGRGYAMMGDPQFATGFKQAQSNIRKDLDLVTSLTLDDPLQAKSTTTLRALMDDQMEYARMNVEKIRRNGNSRHITPEVMAQSQKRIKAIQGLTQYMDGEELSLARRLERQAFQNERQTRLTFFGATAAAVLALIATFALIRQTLHDREASEAAVRQLNAVLERRVEERTESLKAANEGLHAANRELEAFSYTVSHDLRAPLRHVVGFADLLEKKSGELLDEPGRRYVSLIKDAGRRAGLLIDDLLAFSRMSRTELNQTVVSMQAKVEKIQAELALENPERTITWEVGSLPAVWGDMPMLRLVWRNLMENAVKYSSKSPTTHIEIQCRQTATELEFSVKDNGVGFDMAHTENLFGVFQRLHEPEEFEGTGIGLASVRRIIARHEGRTWAESTLGAGATFYFSLPLERLRDEENREIT